MLVSPWPELLPDVVGRNRWRRWEEVSVHWPNWKFFLVTEAERKHVRRRAQFQQHRNASCQQVFFPLQGKAPKEIHAILTETLGEHAPSYATVKNWVAQFKCGDFSACDVPRPGWSTTVSTPEIVDQIHELILEERRISAKSIAEHLGISRERVSELSPSFMEVWTCGSSPRSRSQNSWTRIKNFKGASRLSNFWNFFGAIQMISCRDWWPWTKSS